MNCFYGKKNIYKWMIWEFPHDFGTLQVAKLPYNYKWLNSMVYGRYNYG